MSAVGDADEPIAMPRRSAATTVRVAFRAEPRAWIIWQPIVRRISIRSRRNLRTTIPVACNLLTLFQLL